jgi:adenylate cyclase
MEGRAPTEIGEWIVSAALAGTNETDILAGVCERLNDAGAALWRASIATNLLDPTFDGRSLRWLRGQGTIEEPFLRVEDVLANEEWINSPFFALVESGQPMLRRRLDATYRRGEFALLDQFQDQGATDYVAFAVRIGPDVQLGQGEGMASSWTTDAAHGFSAAHVELLTAIMPTLTLGFTLWANHKSARALITTYLGGDAAERVLAGNIVRGRAEPIRAVVWFSDLVGFTKISDRTGSAEMLALLNDYAEAQVEAIEGNGGHVLKFMGDGLLAIFPDDDTGRACSRALDAAIDQRRRIVALNERRAASGLAVTDTHLALHVGELLYGNLGSPRRLDFTVLGPAVNEAARIEAMCASLDQVIVVSRAFADAAGESRYRLVSLGRYAMKGIARPQELFTLDPA